MATRWVIFYAIPLTSWIRAEKIFILLFYRSVNINFCMSHIARTKRGRVTPRLVVVANVVMVAWWTTLAVLVDLMLKICTFPLTFFRRNGSNGWSLLSEISRRCLLTSRTLKGKKMHVCAGDFLHYEDDVTGYRIIHFRRQIQKKSHEKNIHRNTVYIAL